jgi:hypothetical protein
MRNALAITLTVLIGALPCLAGDADKWVAVRGRFVWDTAKGPAPKRVPLKADKDADVAAKDPDFNSEEWIVNPKNGGIQNVVVWLAPEPTAAADLAALKKAQAENKFFKFPTFKAADIHPDLAKPAKPTVEIDQPCCRFIPHVVLAREGQDMVIKNSAPISHNAHWTSIGPNGEVNPIIPSGQQHVIKGLKAERSSITVSCDMHRWMKAYVRVFDHPYFALTDVDGKFEIKNLPVLGGQLRFFAFHEEAGQHGGPDGRYGKTIEVKPGTAELGEIKLDFKSKTDEKK